MIGPTAIEVRVLRGDDGAWSGHVEIDDDPEVEPRLVRPGGVYADPVTCASILLEAALEMPR